MATTSELETQAINTIRFLAVDAVQKANSGHPGLPMGAAPMAYVLWQRFLKHNPANPKWFNRDRFVLSAGHGSMLIYALLHLTGYDLPLEELKNFRQWGSHTAGHPEYGHTPGIETTTGPLGQGFVNAVGMAIAEAFLAARYNHEGHRIVDHYTYALISDGDVMEGLASEAASLAGHLKLGKLIALYDDNHISLAAPTSVTFTESVPKRFAAYGWHTLSVKDGNDLEAIDAAIREAQAVSDRPSLISIETIIGYGSPNKANSPAAHGSPLGPEEVKLSKQNLGWPPEPEFYIPADVAEHLQAAVRKGADCEMVWEKQFKAYAAAYPELAAEFKTTLDGNLSEGWDTDIPVFPPSEKGMATRNASGKVLNAIAKRVPTFLGGDADLASSTKTLIDSDGDFAADAYDQRNLRYGVREHAMGAITNGLALHGGIIKPYSATFFAFLDYMRPPVRLSALMGIEPIFIFTHDSIGLGEDGPTHQPVEHLATARAIPNCVTFRPCDANETAAVWKEAMSHKGGPVILVFSRQDLPIFDAEINQADVAKGAYVLFDCDGTPDVLLMASGSEVPIIVDAQKLLRQNGVKARVISVPSLDRFLRQDQAYIDRIVPPSVHARVVVEAGVKLGWEGLLGSGRFIGLDHFGASAPYEVIYEKFGLTPQAVVKATRDQLS